MNAMGIVFSYVDEDSLKELTEHRALASVPLAGRYRIIDFVLSNLVNSGVTNVGVITQSNYQSLLDHLGSGKEWDLNRKRDGLFILPPFARRNVPMGGTGAGYRGWLEALSTVYTYIRRSKARHVILTGCETICNIDLEKVVDQHIATGADITCVYRRSELTPESHHHVTYDVDDDCHIRAMLYRPAMTGVANVDMGTFVMEKTFLETLVSEAAARNTYSLFKDIIQRRLNDYRIFGYEFDGTAFRIDSVKAYFNANMQMLNPAVRSGLFLDERPVYTKVRDEVPAIYADSARVRNCLVADGCHIEGEVENSILFRGVNVERGASVKNSIVMQGSVVQRDVQLNYVIVDKDAMVRSGRMLMGYESHPVIIEKGAIV